MSQRSSELTKPVGRRVFLGLTGAGLLGVLFGSKVQSVFGGIVGSGIGGILPGGDRFRIYSVTGSFPVVPPKTYNLKVSGLVVKSLNLSFDDLMAMPSAKLVKDFQCVTGWKVPGVHWEGVKLADILDSAGVHPSAKAVAFDSYDGADSESLTLDQARRSDVIVAYRMLDAPITTAHGGPVRLYVAPMYGYKSLKWLSGIRLVESAKPGYWEQNGYPVDAWTGSYRGHQSPSVL